MQDDINDNESAFDSTIDKEALNDLPLFRFEGPIRLIQSDKDVEGAVAELEKEAVLGFDTETRPAFRKGQNYPPALLQLAGHREVFLFQLLKLTKLDPIHKLLANPQIIKTGVAIRDDIRKLQEHYEFEAAGFVELSHATQRAGIINTGLRSLAGILLGIRISKGAQVSNWSRSDLSPSQVQYAATDAWVSRRLYEELNKAGLLLESA